MGRKRKTVPFARSSLSIAGCDRKKMDCVLYRIENSFFACWQWGAWRAESSVKWLPLPVFLIISSSFWRVSISQNDNSQCSSITRVHAMRLGQETCWTRTTGWLALGQFFFKRHVRCTQEKHEIQPSCDNRKSSSVKLSPVFTCDLIPFLMQFCVQDLLLLPPHGCFVARHCGKIRQSERSVSK